MKNTLHFFFTIIFLLTGFQSFASKESNKNLLCPTATISYAGNPFCTSNATNQAVTLTGTETYLGGVFYSSPGLVINSTTGEILPSISTPGTYVVTYVIAADGSCSEVNTTTIVTILANNTVSAASSTPTLCINTPLTTITHSTTGATGIIQSGLPAGVTATWSGNTITISGTPVMYGVYNYSIPLTGGCGTANATGTITVTMAPNAGTDGNIAICENNSTIDLFTIISGEETGGTWTRTSGSGGTFNAAAGTFTSAIGATSSTFMYTSIGTAPCNNDSSIATLSINPPPTGISISGSTTLCSGNSANLTITGTPNTVVTLSDGSSQNTFAIAASGTTTIAVSPSITTTYTLTSASLNGCTIPVIGQSATISVSATPEFISQIPDISICNGSLLNIGSQLTSTLPGTTFIWSATTSNVNMSAISGDHTNIDQFANLINSTVSGTIIILVIPQIGNCSGVGQQILVTVTPIPGIISTTANDTSICNNQFVTITANSNPSATAYNWQVSSATNVQIMGGATSGTSTTGIINLQLALVGPFASGTISFNIAPVNGLCTGATVITNIITVNPTPDSPIGLPINEICSGEIGSLVISTSLNIAGTILEWTVTDSQNVSGYTSSGSGLSPISINDLLLNYSNVQGFVKYSVNSKLGDCESATTDYIIHVNPLPNSSALTDGEITVDGNGNLVPFVLDTGLDTSNYSFEWYLDNILIPSVNSNTYTATEIGNYSVNVTNYNTNCQNYGYATITESLVNNDNPVDLVMYPNPTSDTLNFNYNSKVKSVQISNQIGQTVLTKQVNLKNGSIDISDLNMGIYNIEFDTEAGIVSHRIIKQ